MKEKAYDMFYGASWIIHKQARDLRKRETKTEKILWNILSNKKLGVKFRRQHPINQFIADFYCHELKLVIEVDGEIHLQKDKIEYDAMRTGIFDDFGIQEIRFPNREILQNPEKIISVLEKIITPKSPKEDF